MGEALTDETDYLGTPVLIARRLCDHAAGGQILCTKVVAALLDGSAQTFPFADQRVLELKGIDAPVPASELLYRERGTDCAPDRNPVCGARSRADKARPPAAGNAGRKGRARAAGG